MTIHKRNPELAAWSAAEAKAKFSEVVDRAVRQGPQTITRNGKPAAVVVSAEEWARRTAPRKRFVEMMDESPLARLDEPLERPDASLRTPDL